jgi:acetolactate synthase I/II/III large subunit
MDMTLGSIGGESRNGGGFEERDPTVAHVIAGFIVRQGLDRVFSLPGGHMKPIWDELTFAGIRIVTARHECAAVEMAQADADLTRDLAVAIVTTGPGLTNAITGIAAAFLARSAILNISTRVPRSQTGMGALEEVRQADLVRPVCRYVNEVADTRHVLMRLDDAATTAVGNEGPAGPAYVDFSTDLLRQRVPLPYRDLDTVVRRETIAIQPDPRAVEAAAAVVTRSRRPLILAGRGAVGAEASIERFIKKTGALYLDTRESRGLLPFDHSGYVPAVRAKATATADLVITLGRRLDFEVAYGSPAGFSSQAQFLRIGRGADEVSQNRLGSVELRSSVPLGLEALLETSCAPRTPDVEWRDSLVETNAAKVEKMTRAMDVEPDGSDGHMHPYRLLAALNRLVDDDTIGIVDGGDILSFARGALRVRTYLDVGAFGCLGTGLPFAIAAGLRFPQRRVIALIGDGALGFNLAELETAVRERARILIVVANNSAWNIERHDQIANYQGRVVGTQLSNCSYSTVAQGLGAYGEHVQHIGALDAALNRALNNLPALVDVTVTRDAISPDTRGGLAQVPDYQAVKSWDVAERELWVETEVR